MKRILAISLLSLIGSATYAQSDSTDLNSYTTPPVLENGMDSAMYGNGMYEEYSLDFTVSNQADFGSVAVEFSTASGQPLYRHTFTLAELQSENLLDANWLFSINFGKFEISQSYKVSIVIGNYAGVLESSITKTY